MPNYQKKKKKIITLRIIQNVSNERIIKEKKTSPTVFAVQVMLAI